MDLRCISISEKLLASLTKWFSERPQWLQIAATQLLQQSELFDKDVSELTTLCQHEAEGKLSKTTCSFPSTVFSQGAAGTLRLCSISDVDGINALTCQKVNGIPYSRWSNITNNPLGFFWGYV